MVRFCLVTLQLLCCWMHLQQWYNSCLHVVHQAGWMLQHAQQEHPLLHSLTYPQQAGVLQIC